MATSSNPNGVTIIEVDGNGTILNTTSGFGQGWRTPNPTTNGCGSPEWLSTLVLAPDPDSLQDILDQIEEAGTFKGDTDPGTSGTTCVGAVFRRSDATAPQPSSDDPQYYVMAQGIWVDESGEPLKRVPEDITPESEYMASAFIISQSPIDKIPSLADQWNTLRQQTLIFFELLEVE
jgi:hypothetical protein